MPKIVKNKHSLAGFIVSLTVMASLACNSYAFEFTVDAGSQDRPAGPVRFQLQKPLENGKVYIIRADGQAGHNAQLDSEGRLWWWSAAMKAGESKVYTVKPLNSAEAKSAREVVKLVKVKEGLIEVKIDGKLFTAFHFGKDQVKPFLYPVIGPTGHGVTRDYPMKENPIEKANKRQDHRHHQSIWCAHGDIRTGNFDKPGSNYWHMAKNPSKQDRQRVKRIVRLVSGPVFGQMEAEIEWITAGGRRQFTEYRTYTFFASPNPDIQIIDVSNVFKFTDSDVMFADTKEGGILSLRIATSMDERGGGRMYNSRGGAGAKQCWGKQAEWCDYVGPVKGETVGIAVMDAKTNFRHPTRWHIRDYGLYTANPFGLSYFVGKDHNGSKVWKKGESAVFNYRILIHKSDTKTARVSDHYRLYTDPPGIVDK